MEDQFATEPSCGLGGLVDIRNFKIGQPVILEAIPIEFNNP
ncbi:MAG: hypothetical protein ABF292_13545 [Desulfobacterales bacterium]